MALAGLAWVMRIPSRSFTFFTALPALARHSSIAAPSPRRSNGSPTSAARFPDSSPRDSAPARRCSFPDHRPHAGPVRLQDRVPLYRHWHRALLIILAAQVLHNPGPDFNVSPAAKKPVSPRIRRNTQQFNSAQMMVTPQFWILYVAFVLTSVGGLMITAQASPVRQERSHSPLRRLLQRSPGAAWPMALAASSGDGSLISSAAKWPC